MYVYIQYIYSERLSADEFPASRGRNFSSIRQCFAGRDFCSNTKYGEDVRLFV